MKIKNAFMLILTAFIWGTAFVAQSMGMDYLEPITFNGVRSLIGGAALIPCIWLLGKWKENQKEDVSANRKALVTGGVLCGLLLFGASSLQQMGIQYTTAGKAGFITAFYIVIVPVLGIFLKKKTGWKVWMAVVLAVVGLYFLCMTESFHMSKGDLLIFFVCADLFRTYISDRSFCTKGRWSENGVYSVFCMRDRISSIHVPAGETFTWRNARRLVSASLCWCVILRRCVHASDHWTEKYESGHCIIAFEPGILLLCTGWMGGVGREVVCKRIHWLCIDVCGDHIGPASGKTAIGRKETGMRNIRLENP